MKITVHRGSNEIGGNCVEVATARTRIILDVGMPLSEMTESTTKQKPTRSDLEKRGVILPIEGLFKNGSKVEAILLSHAHGDHYGLLDHTLQDIPVYLSCGASKMLMAGSLFAGQEELPRKRQKTLKEKESLTIGDFQITPYLVDHSSYGSMAFLIEAERKRIFYSGDLRWHGRKPGMIETIIQEAQRKPIDLLIMEGTALSRDKRPGPSEYDVENGLTDKLRSTEGLALAMFSPQNVDRLISYYKASVRSGRILVLDPYAAFVLHLIHRESKVPNPFKCDHIRIFLPDHFAKSKAARCLKKLHSKFEQSKILKEELLSHPQKYTMVFREWMLKSVFANQLPKGSCLFYSYWSGYLEQENFKKLQARLKELGCGFQKAHASGHIYYQDIFNFIDAIKPMHLMPIHTNASGELASRYKNCIGDSNFLLQKGI